MEQYEERKNRIKALFESPEYQPLKYKELVFLLSVSEEDKPTFGRILQELTEEGCVWKADNGKYVRASASNIVGEFIGNRNGFGFVSVEGEDADYFVPAAHTNRALHGDRVLIKPLTKRGGRGRRRSGASRLTEDKRKEAEVVKVLSPGKADLVGTYFVRNDKGFILVDDPKYNKWILVSKVSRNKAKPGDKCMVHITGYAKGQKWPTGQITECLGSASDPKVDIYAILRGYELPVEFPEEVMQQAKQIRTVINEMDRIGRKDYRDLQTVTIDGDDAKDLDDAITIERDGDGYRLGVHIADVSHYVVEGSFLDQEAKKRGTSVYLPDRVIPMLPKELSNGICSLNAGEDRLTLSCMMQVDAAGKVTDYEICESVICVDCRMSYHAVNEYLEDAKRVPEYAPFHEMITCMLALSEQIREARNKRGSVDFDFPETVICVDAKGNPTEIAPYVRGTAQKIIEDFMLLANETVAESSFWQELPFVYRIHEEPDPEKIERLQALISGFGYYFRTGHEKLHPKEFQKLLAGIADSPEEAMISRVVLRSMKQARYASECSSHFGLAARYYTHFTSPIRRYPDLQIHRILKENMREGLSARRREHYVKILPKVCDACSKLERRADEIEREVEKSLKVRYMAKRIGQVYEGIISGMHANGMFVELPNTVEGMIPLDALYDDYYFYDEQKYAMIGQDTGREYVLGQKIRVRVWETDLQLKTITFALDEDYGEDTEGYGI